jgi:DNA-nicking Smr family endonuclease
MRADDARATLAGIRQRLAERRRIAEEEARRRRIEEARRVQEASLFRNAVGDVRPMPEHGRRPPSRPGAAPYPVFRERDEREALASSLSDGVDGETLIDSDEALSFFRPGVGSQAVRRLRRGEWSVQAHLDLHGMTRDQARAAVGAFLRDAQRDGLRCVRIVHGKGLGSVNRMPVLKNLTRRWLMQSSQVLAFAQARAVDGGAGALLVLLAGAPSAP